MIFYLKTKNMASQTEILQQLSAGQISPEEANELITNLQKPAKSIHLKVTQKGCIGIYGIRKMPISLYHREYEVIRQAIEDGTFSTFIEENKDQLKLD